MSFGFAASAECGGGMWTVQSWAEGGWSRGGRRADGLELGGGRMVWSWAEGGEGDGPRVLTEWDRFISAVEGGAAGRHVVQVNYPT